MILVLSACIGQKKKPLEGAWQLVNVQYQKGNTIVNEPISTPDSQLKMRTENHFAFLSIFAGDSTTFNGYGGGTYTLNGTMYEENVKYHNSKSLIDNTIKMKLEIRNDTLRQFYPADENGNTDLLVGYTTEIYVRSK